MNYFLLLLHTFAQEFLFIFKTVYLHLKGPYCITYRLWTHIILKWMDRFLLIWGLRDKLERLIVGLGVAFLGRYCWRSAAIFESSPLTFTYTHTFKRGRILKWSDHGWLLLLYIVDIALWRVVWHCLLRNVLLWGRRGFRRSDKNFVILRLWPLEILYWAAVFGVQSLRKISLTACLFLNFSVSLDLFANFSKLPRCHPASKRPWGAVLFTFKSSFHRQFFRGQRSQSFQLIWIFSWICAREFAPSPKSVHSGRLLLNIGNWGSIRRSSSLWKSFILGFLIWLCCCKTSSSWFFGSRHPIKAHWCFLIICRFD